MDDDVLAAEAGAGGGGNRKPPEVICSDEPDRERPLRRVVEQQRLITRAEAEHRMRELRRHSKYRK